MIRTFFIYISFITLSTYCMENANEQESSSQASTLSELEHNIFAPVNLNDNRFLHENLDMLYEDPESPSGPDNKMCIFFANLSCGLTLCPLIFEKHQQS